MNKLQCQISLVKVDLSLSDTIHMERGEMPKRKQQINGYQRLDGGRKGGGMTAREYGHLFG